MKHRYPTIAAITCLAFVLITVSSNTAPTSSAQMLSKAPQESLQVVSATLTASPGAYDGQCPVTINFSGNITVKGRGQVRYTFVRSDGATGPVYTLDFEKQDSISVDTTWTLSLPTFNEWVAIRILSPNEMESERAFFKGSCGKPATGPSQRFKLPTIAVPTISLPKPQAQEQSLQVTSAKLVSTPEVYDGQCPVTLRFNGEITATGKGPVQYTFIRSDGATARTYTLDFNGAETKAVDTTWTISLAAFNGWVAIKILSPNELESEHAFFKGTCLNQIAPPANPAPVTGAGPNRPVLGAGPNRPVLGAGPGTGRNWDFEEGLAGWTPTGDAFANQPTMGDNVIAARVRTDMMLENGGIGGDYWKRVPYPIGHHLDAWIGTNENHPDVSRSLGVIGGDGTTGTLTSGDFLLDENARFIAFMVGGGRDVANERVELQVRGEDDADVAEVARLVAANRGAAAGLAALFGGSTQAGASGIGSRDGNYVVTLVASGQNSEVMRPIVFEVPATLRGRFGRIRIVDNSSGPWGHINADDFRFGRVRPSDRPPRVWGFADTHAHPMNDLSFGGNVTQGSLYARDGSPFGSDRFRRTALPPLFENLQWSRFLDLAAMLFPGFPNSPAPAAIGETARELTRASRSGYPEHLGYPSFSMVAGQTMYGEWIHRAYDGGLRLMSALAVNNWLASSHPLKRRLLGTSQPEDDRGSADVQVKDIKEWAGRPENRTWVEIAFTPADARRIISSNKLAIVVGLELDVLGNFVPNNHFREPGVIVMPTDPEKQRALISEELDRLYAQGVRQVGPFHYVSGVWGGTAMSQRLFNEVNRKVTGSNVKVDSGDVVGIRYRLDMDAWKADGQIIRTIATGDAPHLQEDPSWAETKLGHINRMGLNPAGEILFDELARRGMLIDLDHAGYHTTEDMLRRAQARHYPVMSSHSDFLELGFTGEGDFSHGPLADNDADNLARFDTTSQLPLRHEGMVSRHKIETIAQLGGTTGAILWLPRRTKWGDAVPNDCDGSSKTWAQLYQYAVDVSGGRGVALSTDRITIEPRFGPNAAYQLGTETSSMPRRDERRFEQVDAQSNGVRYDRPIKEWSPLRFKTEGNSAWQKTPVHGSTSWESRPAEHEDAWKAIALWIAGPNPRRTTAPGVFGNNPRYVDYAWGFHSENEGELESDGVHPSTTLDSRFAAYCVKKGITPSELRKYTNAPGIWEQYWWVKRVWDEWGRMNGTNDPLRRHVFGNRDFDVNFDGVAHYGLLPDFLQDVANSHSRPAEVGAYFDPLFRSAEDYIQMWEKARQAAGLRDSEP